MFMFESPLNRHAGPIAVIAGGLFASSHVGLFVFFDQSDLAATMVDPAYLFFSAAYAMTFPLLLIALVALYARQASRAGQLGAVAFCIALTGTVALAGDMWFEAFAAPWAAGVAPVLLEVRHGSVLLAAWFVSVVLFAAGWALFGLVSYRTRAFPRAFCVGVMVGGLLGYFAAQPPWGLALGVAVAAVGVWLIRHSHTGQGAEAHSAAEPVAVAATR
jgi:hypothetical protein